MPQSLAKVYLHAVFSTKEREAILADPWRDERERPFQRRRPWSMPSVQGCALAFWKDAFGVGTPTEYGLKGRFYQLRVQPWVAKSEPTHSTLKGSFI